MSVFPLDGIIYLIYVITNTVYNDHIFFFCNMDIMNMELKITNMKT